MKQVLTFGEVMLRLATPGFERFGQSNILNSTFGGSEVNTGVSLANFGLPVGFVTRLPKNDIAEACARELRGLGVDTSKIVYGGERMGIYFLETGAVSRGSKVIYDRSNSAMAQIKPGDIDWEKAFDNVGWFHWSGITPAISQNAADVCAEAIKIANSKGITVSCDLNYRSNLWKYGKTPVEVMPALVAGCDVLLSNGEAADKMLGIKPNGIDTNLANFDIQVNRAISELTMQKYPRCKHILTTLRGSVNANNNSLSGVLFDGKNMYEAPVYQITNIVDRVGGGDAFMGGLIYGMLTYKSDLQKVLNFAVAASCLKHTIYGDYNRVSVEEVEKLMQGDASGRVSR